MGEGSRNPVGMATGQEGEEGRHTRIRNYAVASQAANTRRTYAAAWRDWLIWTEATGFSSLPADPEAVAAYLVDLADRGRKLSTLRLRVAALGAAHREAGQAFDARHQAIATILAGIRRLHGARPTQKAPLLRDDLIRMLVAIETDTLKGRRDRALLLLGFAGALRRSELAGLRVSDMTITPRGLVLVLRQTKTDSTGMGQEVAVPRGHTAALCPVAAVQAWLKEARIESGPIFRRIWKGGRVGAEAISDRTVAELVKSRARAVGIDPHSISGHSLRAGLASSAALDGADLLAIMRQTRHKSMEVARGYVRIAERWQGNVAGRLL